MPPADAAAAVRRTCEAARAAARRMAAATRGEKDAALAAVAKQLRESAGALAAANAADVEAARAAGRPAAMIDRLVLDAGRIEAMARAVEEVARLDDPVGEVTGMRRRPKGILVGRARIPLGVVAVVYEARPNVTIDAAALCLKSGNCVVLRGGSEAARSSAALVDLARAALDDAGLPADAVLAAPPGDREEVVSALVGAAGLVDLAIPRGGEALVRLVTERARVPVVQHFKGVCHLFVDEGASHAMAIALVEDGKAVRPGVCNALECLLVHDGEAAAFLPALGALAARREIELRGDARTVAIVPGARPAAEDDWGCEFLAKILAVRVVGGLDEALGHVARYGSGHTEAICTPSWDRGQRWLREVDASCVLVNASTRFNDGGELGLGAEIGISTSKIHAYGPMGLESLTTCKWIVMGDGQVRG